MKLNRLALENLAAENAAFGDDADALDRLCSLVAPFVSDFGTTMISPSQVERSFSENFGLKVPNEVAAVCLGRLAKRGVISMERVGDAVVFAPKEGGHQKESTRSGHDLVDLAIADVRRFLNDRPLLPALSDDEILDVLGEKLFRLDTFQFIEESKSAKQDWKANAISEYVLSKRTPEGDLPPVLSGIAELSLMSLAIQGLTTKRVNAQKSNLIVILDTPIALALLGASGNEAKASALATFDAAEKLGVRKALLITSVEEIRRVIFSVIETLPPNRTGPAAGAIRRNEITEERLRDIGNFPEKYLKQSGIQILPDRLKSFPDSHHFFSENDYTEFSGFATRWNDRREAQDHDAELLAISVRKRRGQSDPNVLFCPNVVVTNNWAFTREAKRFCCERFYFSEKVTAPVVHINDFSASVWLAAGFATNRVIPRRSLLANCERLIGGNGSLLAKAKSIFRRLENYDSQEIELLLRDRDCVMEIFSQTAGDPSLLNEDNSFLLLKAVKERIVREEQDKYLAELERIKEIHSEELSKIYDDGRKSADENLAEVRKLNAMLEDFKAETRRLLDQKEYQITDLLRQNQEQVRERQLRFAKRILSFEKRNEYVSSSGAAAAGFLVPLAAGLLTAFSTTFKAGVYVTILIGVVYTFALLRVPPISWVLAGLKRFHVTRQFLKEFSLSERAEWDLRLSSDLKVSTENRELAATLASLPRN